MELAHSGWLRSLLHFFSFLIHFFAMPSTADICKRALVTLIRALAVAYGFRVAVTRDATDQVIKRAYHTTSKRTHPDKGGSTEDQKRLNLAYEAWDQALRKTAAPGRPASVREPARPLARPPLFARPCSHARPPARPPRERARSLRGKSVEFYGRTAVPIVRTGFAESNKIDFVVQSVAPRVRF